MARFETFFTKIVGVSHRNPDGSSRQDLLARCTVGEHVHLVREPRNKHDANAIAVELQGGDSLGYLKASLASELAPFLDRRGRTVAAISALTGGEAEKFRGANLLIVKFDRKDAQKGALALLAESLEKVISYTEVESCLYDHPPMHFADDVDFREWYEGAKRNLRQEALKMHPEIIGEEEETALWEREEKRYRHVRQLARLETLQKRQKEAKERRLAQTTRQRELFLAPFQAFWKLLRIAWLFARRFHHRGLQTDLYLPILGGLGASVVIVTLIFVVRSFLK